MLFRKCFSKGHLFCIHFGKAVVVVLSVLLVELVFRPTVLFHYVFLEITPMLYVSVRFGIVVSDIRLVISIIKELLKVLLILLVILREFCLLVVLVSKLFNRIYVRIDQRIISNFSLEIKVHYQFFCSLILRLFLLRFLIILTLDVGEIQLIFSDTPNKSLIHFFFCRCLCLGLLEDIVRISRVRFRLFVLCFFKQRRKFFLFRRFESIIYRVRETFIDGISHLRDFACSFHEFIC